MIELLELSKSFSGKKILDSVSLKIETGSTCVIIGRSGCGKSVLLKQIVGLLKPDSGKVMIDNQEVGGLDEKALNLLRLKIGMVFQAGALFDSMTVAENVGFGLAEHGQDAPVDVPARIEEALGLVNLSGIGDRMPSELSGGMKKRVALARSLCIKPEIILYDEPTTGLDPVTADSIDELIKQLHDTLKVTSVVVTHDMKSAYRIADRICMLYQGKVIAQGSAEEIRNSVDPIVHQFVNGLAHGPITDTQETDQGSKK